MPSVVGGICRVKTSPPYSKSKHRGNATPMKIGSGTKTRNTVSAGLGCIISNLSHQFAGPRAGIYQCKALESRADILNLLSPPCSRCRNRYDKRHEKGAGGAQPGEPGDEQSDNRPPEGWNDPLLDSTREYVEQIDRYKEHQGKRIDRKPRVVSKPHSLVCAICGTAFAGYRAGAKFCSRRCQGKGSTAAATKRAKQGRG